MTDVERTEKKVDGCTTNSGATSDQLTVEEWLAIRKEAGLIIDPETAEVFWTYARTADPYGVRQDLTEEQRSIVGREYFARSPGSDIWVSFDDLPDSVLEALRQRAAPDNRAETDRFDLDDEVSF
jgi:hypothetical protein